ncbi:sporulation integral membrane protein YlbJ [Clostridium aestuarii]|uniref:Sporulation integral membrane protein YlbJ n=1 Tax=Clostridium aestuarii TaxID=338193 RepID=A0ABT4CYP9_9CLOT|nr:sporulation integral membrane protein YlbJ [Clostridium aestuarii]MCY6483987.1 sporulation integral membrane protein YlbJ [Clostridium aestuarii]
MKIIFILLIISIAFLIFKLLSNKISNLNKDIFVTILCTLLILNIILKPELCLNSALNGCKLFIKSVFVSLFPFLVLINIMLSYNAVDIYSKFFGKFLCKPLKLPENCSVVLIVSILCGYPLGAKYACELYNKNSINFSTCERLISIASNPSPLFVIGTVGTSMLNNSFLGVLLLVSCYISCFLTGLLLSPTNTNHLNKKTLCKNNQNNKNIGEILKTSIDNALSTSLSIGGFVVFFSVLTVITKNNIIFDIVLTKLSILLHIPECIIKSFCLGILEITNGCSLISAGDFSITLKIILISFLLSFGGISITGQVYSITHKFNFSLIKYIKRKFFQGILCSILAVLFYKFSILNLSKYVFNLQTQSNELLILNRILVIQLFLLLFPFTINKINKLLNRFS